MRHSIVKLIGNTEKSYYRWKKEKRLVISLLEKYFTKNEIDEFIQTKQIARLELDNSLTQDLAYNFYDLYFNKLFAKDNDQSSTLCRAYFLSFLDHLNSNPMEFNNIKDVLEELDRFINFTKWSACQNSYIKEIEVSGAGEVIDNEAKRYCPFNCHKIIYKLLINFTGNDVRYLLLNIKNDFKYFYGDLKKIHEQSGIEYPSTESNREPWVEYLNNKYNLVDVNIQSIGLFDIEIFRAEFKCIKENIDIKTSRDKIDILIKDFGNTKFTLQNEVKCIKKIQKI